MQINESTENYLERILIIGKKKAEVHSVDIACELNVTKASVSHAMKLLRENGYIQVDSGGMITLLPKGQEIAERIYERHTLLYGWLTALGVKPEVAVEDACRIEHVISAESFEAIKAHVAERKNV